MVNLENSELIIGKLAQKTKKPGKVRRYNMYDEIMTKEMFLSLSLEDQNTALRGLLNKHKVAEIASVWGVNKQWVYDTKYRIKKQLNKASTGTFSTELNAIELKKDTSNAVTKSEIKEVSKIDSEVFERLNEINASVAEIVSALRERQPINFEVSPNEYSEPDESIRFVKESITGEALQNRIINLVSSIDKDSMYSVVVEIKGISNSQP